MVSRGQQMGRARQSICTRATHPDTPCPLGQSLLLSTPPVRLRETRGAA